MFPRNWFELLVLILALLVLAIILLLLVNWALTSNNNSKHKKKNVLLNIVKPNSYVVEVMKPVYVNTEEQADQHLKSITNMLNIPHIHSYKYALYGFSTENISDAKLIEIRNHPEVNSVSPNFYYYAPPRSTIEVDPMFQVKSPTNDKINWGLTKIGAETAALSTIPVDADVIVLDTGVANHKDLNVVERKSFILEEPDIYDNNGHGTHVAGIIGANNRSGIIVGVAPGVRIHAYKVLGANGSGEMVDILAGMDEITKAIDSGKFKLPVIVNMSIGVEVGEVYTKMDEILVRLANTDKVIFTVAAGNEYTDASNYSPAHVPEAITVSAYGPRDMFADFSNYGRNIDVNAPGVDILSAGLNYDDYVLMSGTSMAAPMVAGLIAQAVSKQSIQDLDRNKVVNDWQNLPKNFTLTNLPSQTTGLVAKLA